MLISSPEELRLYSPSNAIDNIETMAGFFDSSEQDFLKDKLGAQLHQSLVEYYQSLRDGEGAIAEYIGQIVAGTPLPPYARLLTLAQRIITFDALGRAIDQQAISVNGAGINIGVADDYQKVDPATINAYKQSCIKESHAAINALLVTLEEWTQEVNALDPATIEPESSNAEKKEITDYWRTSRYFFLAASLAIPSATILQEYLDIYGSREKFILMLPDLRFIQEDILTPIIGEDLMDFLTETAIKGTDDRLLKRIIHRLRKAMARHLESRTMQIKVGDPRRETAHNEAVQLTSDLSSYLQTHQPDMEGDLLKAFKTSPLYVAPATEPEASASGEYTPEFENNASGSVMFVTPALD